MLETGNIIGVTTGSLTEILLVDKDDKISQLCGSEPEEESCVDANHEKVDHIHDSGEVIIDDSVEQKHNDDVR